MSLHVWHYIVEQPFSFARVEHRQYVIVREACSHLDLSQESVGANFRGDFGAQDLHRHHAFVAQIAGEIDDSHSTFAELPVDGVTIGKSRFESLLEVVHVTDRP
jgi:hypothetical protein